MSDEAARPGRPVGTAFGGGAELASADAPAPATEPRADVASPSARARPVVRRFRRRLLTLADGASLVLNPSGSIDEIDDAGTVVHSWDPADPEWPRHAIRFGLRPQAPTVAPTGRRVGGSTPPR